MARKRTSLASLLDSPADPANSNQTAKAASGPKPKRGRGGGTPAAAPEPQGRRAHVKQQTVYLPLPVYEQLRRLAFEERSKMHSLLMEGLDRVFQDRGLTAIADLAPDSADKSRG